jgi:fructoselysine/glucoselysine PTS system EIIA component
MLARYLHYKKIKHQNFWERRFEMRTFLIATHGHFADGIYDSLKMIMGEQKNVMRLNAYVEKGFDIGEKVKQIMASLSPNEELIVITDIYGGSVNNEFMRYLSDWRLHLISGLNLPLLIELISTSDAESTNTSEWLLKTLDSTNTGIQYCNELLRQKELIEEENF